MLINLVVWMLFTKNHMQNKADLSLAINNFFPLLNAKHKLPPYKFKALNALKLCRTGFMGGHIEACDECGEMHFAFNSCRNRNCPKCGAIEKEKWIISREADLLPVKYFHVVFTPTSELNGLCLRNPRFMYDLLFEASWYTIRTFGEVAE